MPRRGHTHRIDAGCDLEAIDDLESYARVIVIAHAVMADDDREAFGSWFLQRAVDVADGLYRPDDDGEPVEPTKGRYRHFLWLAEGLLDPDVAHRFETALPAAMARTRAARR